MRSREPGRIRPRAGSGSSDGGTPAEWPRTTALLHLRLPRARIDQLQALAERHGLLATTMVAQWVLARLAEHDPDDALLPAPGRAGPLGTRLASVTRLPRLDAVDEPPDPGPAAGPGSETHAPQPQAPGAAPTRTLPARRRPPGSESHPAGMRLPGATRAAAPVTPEPVTPEPRESV